MIRTALRHILQAAADWHDGRARRLAQHREIADAIRASAPRVTLVPVVRETDHADEAEELN